MNSERIETIASAVLYEGYNLYPYRPSSVKNRQRWTFGGVCPHAFSEAQRGAEAWTLRTECIAIAGPDTKLTLQLRFLHPLQRTVGVLTPPLAEMPSGGEPAFRPVASLEVGDQTIQSWDEAVERSVVLPDLSVRDLLAGSRRQAFAFAAQRELEPVHGADGAITAVLVRDRKEISGELSVMAEAVVSADGLTGVRLAVTVENLTECPDAESLHREEAMLQSFVSTHLLLGLSGGEFVSSIDPAEPWSGAVAGCHNSGLWPVLVGDEDDRDAMLAAPIILYDHPQIAPESPGDLFDGTEIDEILTLRIMTLTDDERRAVRGSDARTRALLDRTDTLPGEQLAKLHGALRGLRPLESER